MEADQQQLNINPIYLPERKPPPYWGKERKIPQFDLNLGMENVITAGVLGGGYAAMRGFNPYKYLRGTSTAESMAAQSQAIHRALVALEEHIPVTRVFGLSELASRYATPDTISFSAGSLTGLRRENAALATVFENALGGINLDDYDLGVDPLLTFKRVEKSVVRSPWYEIDLWHKQDQAFKTFRVKFAGLADKEGSKSARKIAEASLRRNLRINRAPGRYRYEHLYPSGHFSAKRLNRDGATWKLFDKMLGEDVTNEIFAAFHKTKYHLDIGNVPKYPHDLTGEVAGFSKAFAKEPKGVISGIIPLIGKERTGDIPIDIWNSAKALVRSPTLDWLGTRSFEFMQRTSFTKWMALSNMSIATWQGAAGSFLLKRVLPGYIAYKVGARAFDAVNGKQILAGAYQSASLGYARFAEGLGLIDYKRSLEEKFPNITDPLSYVGIPLGTSFLTAGIGKLYDIANDIGAVGTKGSGRAYGEELNTIQKAVRKELRLAPDQAKSVTKRLRNIIDINVETARRAYKNALPIGRAASKADEFGALAKYFLGTSKMRTVTGLAIGVAAMAPFLGLALPGIIAPEHTPEELESIYSGRMDVPVKRGKGWMLSIGTPYEGRKVSYYAPHWSVMMKADSRNIGIYGSKEEQYKSDWFWNLPKILCVCSDMLVITGNSFAKIEDLYGSSISIVSHKGTLIDNCKVHRRKLSPNEKVIAVSAFGLPVPLKLTSDHLVPVIKTKNCIFKSSILTCKTWNRGWCKQCKHRESACEIKWVKAEEIGKGDYLVEPVVNSKPPVDYIVFNDIVKNTNRKYVVTDGKILLESNNNRTFVTGIPEHIVLDKLFGEFVGIYLAEGSVCFAYDSNLKQPRGITTTHNVNELPYIETIYKKICERFDLHYSYSIRKRKSGTALTFTLYSAAIGDLFYNWLGHGSRNKVSPHKSNNEFDIGIITGLIIGDGGLQQENTKLVFTSTSANLIFFVKNTLAHYGIGCSVKKHGSDDAYKVIVSCGSLVACNELSDICKYYRISTNKKTPSDQIRVINVEGTNYTLHRVTNVIPIQYNGYVYDIETNYKDRSFTLLGAAVHNSGDERWRYRMELRNYNRRPYPLTGTVGEDIPFIGGLFAATVGEIIKPTREMHTEYWKGDGKRRIIPTGGSEIGLGELSEPSGSMYVEEAMRSTSPEYAIGETFYRSMIELPGFQGFMIGTGMQSLFGTETPFETKPMLESAARITSMERRYWDYEIGDMAGACFVAGTKVQTIDGWEPIETILPGKLVATIDGSFKLVVDNIERKAQEVYTLTTYGIGASITGTGNHHIPILKATSCTYESRRPCIPGNKITCDKCSKRLLIEDTNLCEVREGDWVVTPIYDSVDEIVIDLSKLTDRTFTDKYVYNRCGIYTAKAYELLESNICHSRAELRKNGIPDRIAKDTIKAFREKDNENYRTIMRFDRYVDLDSQLAYFIGWYIAEGYTESNGRIGLTMNSSEISYAKELSNIVYTKFGAQSSIVVSDNTLELRVQCIPLQLLLSIFGKGAKKKHIPGLIKRSRADIKKALLKGVILGDGWCNKSARKSGFTSVSADLCIDVFDLAISLGIKGHMLLNYMAKSSGNYPQGTPRNDCKRSYISWTTVDSDNISALLNNEEIINAHKKNIRTFVKDELLFSQVRNVVKENELRDVYDLQIEGLHYYVAEHIVVHNTELFRRLVVPHRRRSIPLYNPIPNDMREAYPFLPGSDYFIDFGTGDPYCLYKDTYVEMFDGSYKKADQIKKGDLLIDAKGEPTTVIATNIRESETGVKVTLSHCPAHPILCSKDHPFLINTVKDRKRKPRLEIYRQANRILQECKPGMNRVQVAVAAGVHLSIATKAWKILDYYKKVKVSRKGQSGTITVIDNTPIDEDLINKGLLFKEANDLKVGQYVAYPAPKLAESIDRIDLALIFSGWSAVTENHVYYQCCQTTAENIEYLLGERTSPGNSSVLHVARSIVNNLKGPYRKRYKRYIDLTRELGNYVGLWCAEGWVGGTAHHAKEENEVLEIYNAVGLTPKWRKHKLHNSATATIRHKALEKLLVYLCGKGARTKVLAPEIFLAPKPFIEGFLDGLFYGDGSEFESDGRKVKSLKTSSEILALQVKRLLLSLGIMSSVIVSNESVSFYEGKVIKGGKSWTVKIHGDGKNYDGCTWYRDDNYFYFRVNSIELVDPEETYGFMTDSGTFCVTGAATHNTKVPHGESRLPGEGFEAIQPRVKETGYTSDIQLQILSSIAPWSKEYKNVSRTVAKQISEGVYSPERTKELREYMDHATRIKKGVQEEFHQYKWTPWKRSLETQKVTVKEVIAPGIFTTEQHPYEQIIMDGISMSDTTLRQLRGAKNLNESKALLNETLGQHIYEGAELEVVVPNDVLARMTESSVPKVKAAVISDGVNLNKLLIEKNLAKKTNASKALETLIHGNMFDAVIGTGWETITHSGLPFISKFAGARTALEDYERTYIYGRPIRMWQHPWSHLLKPSIMSIGNKLGWSGVPGDVKERREIDDYFDKVEWFKWFRLEQAAMQAGQAELAEKYREKKVSTSFGAAPLGYSGSLYRAIPKIERQYFNDFENAKSAEERSRILEIVPEQVGRILQSRWENRIMRDMIRKVSHMRDKDIRSSDYRTMVHSISDIMERRVAEGFQYSKELMNEYHEEVGSKTNVSYADWMRLRNLNKYFKKHKVPANDWVGYYPGVNMNEVKLVYLESAGKDIHDFNLWGSDIQELAGKEYLMEEDQIYSPFDDTNWSAATLNTVLSNETLTDIIVESSGNRVTNTSIFVDQTDDIERMVYYNQGLERMEGYVEDGELY